MFAEIRIPVDRTEAAPPERARSTQDVATNEEGVRGRVFAIVLDELHTDARRSGEVRKLAREFVELHMARNDVAAVVSTGGRADATLGFTGDRPRLLEAVERFAGRKTRSATLERLDTIERQRDLLRAEPDTRNAPPPPERQLAPRPGLERDPSDLQRVHDARAAMGTLERAARSFGGLDGRRKAIVWFGEGIDYDTLDVMGKTERNAPAILQSMREAIATATRHGVAVYAVDPRGGSSASGPDDDPDDGPRRGGGLRHRLAIARPGGATLAGQPPHARRADGGDRLRRHERLRRGVRAHRPREQPLLPAGVLPVGFPPRRSVPAPRRPRRASRPPRRSRARATCGRARRPRRPSASDRDRRRDIARAASAARQPVAAARASARSDGRGVQGQRARRGGGGDDPAAATKPAAPAGARARRSRDGGVVRRDRPGRQGAGRRAHPRPTAGQHASPAVGTAARAAVRSQRAPARGAISASRGRSRGGRRAARLGLLRLRGARLRGPEAGAQQRADHVAPVRARAHARHRRGDEGEANDAAHRDAPLRAGGRRDRVCRGLRRARAGARGGGDHAGGDARRPRGLSGHSLASVGQARERGRRIPARGRDPARRHAAGPVPASDRGDSHAR